MKAYMEKGDVLVIEAENPMEDCALKFWQENGTPHGVLRIRISGTYSFVGAYPPDHSPTAAP